MAIELLTWGTGTMTSMNDAVIHDVGVGASGILFGCGVTANGNTLTVAAGYGLIKGRLFQVTSTDVTVTLSSGADQVGRIFVKLDLSNATTPISIETSVGSSLYELTQEDNANYTDGVYEISLATFAVTTSEITELTADKVTIGYDNTYYLPGESVTFAISGAGYITAGYTAMVIPIPINKRTGNISGATIDSSKLKAIQGGSYLLGGGGNNWAVIGSSNLSGSISIKENMIVLTVMRSGGYAGSVNNEVCGVTGEITLTFS